jgi:hypothetical protein
MAGVWAPVAEENIGTEESGRLKELHNDELLNIYSSSHPIKVIKSRKMKWIMHIACIEDHLKDLDVSGRIGLLSKWVLEK